MTVEFQIYLFIFKPLTCLFYQNIASYTYRLLVKSYKIIPCYSPNLNWDSLNSKLILNKISEHPASTERDTEPDYIYCTKLVCAWLLLFSNYVLFFCFRLGWRNILFLFFTKQSNIKNYNTKKAGSFCKCTMYSYSEQPNFLDFPVFALS